MEKDGNSKNELVEGLKLAAQGNSRSKTARLREIFDEVEAAKAAGLSLKTIVDVLESRGLKFNLETFVNIRHRIKNERRNGKQNSAQKVNKNAFVVATSEDASKTEIVVKPVVAVANSGGKKERLTPELRNLVVNSDLSLDDEVYEQFRKKE